MRIRLLRTATTFLSKNICHRHNAYCSMHRPYQTSGLLTPRSLGTRFFCSLTESEFRTVAGDALENLSAILEEKCADADEFESVYASGVVTVRLGPHGTYVLNRQVPTRQIWLSSPISGPSRFDWDSEQKQWVGVMGVTETPLHELLSKELSSMGFEVSPDDIHDMDH
eukprot:Rmarinus@m.17858